MAGHNWEQVRDLGLALRANDAARAIVLTREIQAGQASCAHVLNPDASAPVDEALVRVGLTSTGKRCYKCGLGMVGVALVGPGVSKVKPLMVAKKRTACL